MRNRKQSQQRRATQADVAAELGVSLMTVSNAFNRPAQLSAGLRQRVLETAERLGYPGPDPLGRGLRRGRTGAVGVLYPNRLSYAFDDAAAIGFLGGLSTVLEDQHFGMLLVPGSSRPKRDVAAIRQAMVDGVVVYSLARDDPLLQAVLERRLPTVIVDQPSLAALPLVGIDDTAAARTAAAHLCELGHRRFAVISFALSHRPAGGIVNLEQQQAASFDLTRSRLHGYAAALQAAGIPWRDVPVYECPDSAEHLGAQAATALLARQPRPTALLALSDRLAIGALTAARQQGLRVPTEVSVAGFDDIPAAATTDPPLTTIHQDHRHKGRLAADLLTAQLQGHQPPAPQPLPAPMVVRYSTAEPPVNNNEQ